MSEESLLAPKKERLVSLDVFRGITIAGMILVNHPGSWGQIYKPLGHAEWNGWTPTDLIFPFFLFIVGVAMTFSFDRRIAKGQSRMRLFEHVARRAIILVMLGLTMYGFPDIQLIGPFVLVIVGLWFLFAHEPPFGMGTTPRERNFKIIAWTLLIAALVYFIVDFRHFQETNLRVPGVLQRIGVAYFFASVVVLTCGLRGRIFWTAALILGYWAIIRLIPAPAGVELPAERQAHLLNEWIDVKLLGGHIYRERPDPEGILSTLPAIATTLAGVLTGMWLHSNRSPVERLTGLFVAANAAMVVGLCMDPFFPINKKIWSSSYVVFTAGLGLHFLAMCYWLIDIKGWQKWSKPFVVFGTNAILVFFAAHLTSKMMGRLRWELADGTTTSLYSWIYRNLFASWAGPLNGSLAFAITYVLLWLVILIPLYRKRIFLKI